MTTPTTDRIRKLNDILRTTWLTGTVTMTSGIKSLPEETQSQIAEAVQGFSTFTADNDPHGEHDFGSLSVNEHKVFWKIDYYDQRMEYASPNPVDPEVTNRVLTIMLADEY